jgi:NAD(P)-dependent dehydrogenase (short-subunit alcohol dehydrogenase family)
MSASVRGLRKEEQMKDHVVFITGSSSGIGRETAYRFAKEGARVILTYYRGRARGEAAERRCIKLGAGNTLLLHLDLTDAESVAECVKKVKRMFGSVDFLVNNAGVGVFRPFEKQTIRDIERQIRTNLEGLIRVTFALLPFVKRGIVNIASAAGKTAYEEMSVYCGTKFGVRGFTQSLALEYPRLRICCVNPDMTATRLSGYEGRPPGEVAEVIYRAITGKARCSGSGDLDVWKIM